jgi:hypothetical protein
MHKGARSCTKFSQTRRRACTVQANPKTWGCSVLLEPRITKQLLHWSVTTCPVTNALPVAKWPWQLAIQWNCACATTDTNINKTSYFTLVNGKYFPRHNKYFPCIIFLHHPIYSNLSLTFQLTQINLGTTGNRFLRELVFKHYSLPVYTSIFSGQLCGYERRKHKFQTAFKVTAMMQVSLRLFNCRTRSLGWRVRRYFGNSRYRHKTR